MMEPTESTDRAGRYVRHPSGYDYFVPEPLPPPDLDLTAGFLTRLSLADRALARLDGAASVLPNPDLFVFMYVRREAVLSSQIEGTQASLDDLLEAEAELASGERRVEIDEVVNYVGALRYGILRLDALPVSLRLVRELHERLMQGVRGGEPSRTPGQFRRSQDWIGGTSPSTARFVPPLAEDIATMLSSWERFIHDTAQMPDLVRIALIHAQFETIHPFLDGNGRIGRLLISILLHQWEIIQRPLLYLSIFFKEHRDLYYERLQAVRDNGEWEEWIDFFIEGVATVATEAYETATEILALRERDRERLVDLGRRSGTAHKLLDYLFERPVISVALATDVLGVSQPTANALVNAFEEAGLLRETTGYRRNRKFEYVEYLDLFGERGSRQ